MKKSIFAVCLITLISQASSSQDQPPKTNFRETSWGITQAAIVKLEGQEPKFKQKTDVGLDAIGYSGKAGSLDCQYAYFFADDKLVEGRYVFTESHTNKNAYIDDFKTAKDSLTEKYGKPKTDRIVWNNNLYKDDPGEWGMAISVGHLAYEAIWTLDDTKITLRLTGDNYTFLHVLQYLSTLPEHIELTKKAAEKAKKGIW